MPRLISLLLFAPVVAIVLPAAFLFVAPGNIGNNLLWLGILSPLIWPGLMFYAYWDGSRWRPFFVLLALIALSAIIILLHEPLTA